ncbi:hypothetical protein GGR56DRAFT_645996 [Xylariaceae sp. FL0804]|nr:hypothetical protein GGR56DRAFT_645996 [Xylariaceae sp. FL0804]
MQRHLLDLSQELRGFASSFFFSFLFFFREQAVADCSDWRIATLDELLERIEEASKSFPGHVPSRLPPLRPPSPFSLSRLPCPSVPLSDESRPALTGTDVRSPAPLRSVPSPSISEQHRLLLLLALYPLPTQSSTATGGPSSTWPTPTASAWSAGTSRTGTRIARGTRRRTCVSGSTTTTSLATRRASRTPTRERLVVLETCSHVLHALHYLALAKPCALGFKHYLLT